MIMSLREKRDLLDDAILALERFAVAGARTGRRVKRLAESKSTAKLKAPEIENVA
jgi:hypothetical protein